MSEIETLCAKLGIEPIQFNMDTVLSIEAALNLQIVSFMNEQAQFTCICNFRDDKGYKTGYESKAGNYYESFCGLVNKLWPYMREDEKYMLQNNIDK